MSEVAAHASIIPPILTFCAAAAIAVPIAKRLKLGAVIGYLLAGVIMGPSLTGLVTEPHVVRGVAEFGVILLLFIIGIELKISRLFEMRRAIFGLGGLQWVLTGAMLTGLGYLLGESLRGAFLIGMALALSATAVALHILEERDDRDTPYGEQTFAVLLFQDMAIVPLLALAPLLAGAGLGDASAFLSQATLISVGKAISAIGIVVLVGRYGLNPFFRILAATGAREVMTAAALLVVLGSAMLMELTGLSMAMGAFLAGVMLAESDFRHQLEADIEPFRGMLLGLFFMSVGMSLDLSIVWQNWLFLVIAAPVLIALKMGIAAFLCRAFGAQRHEGLRSAALLSPAGEFAFVIIPLAASLALVSPQKGQLYTALAALTMLMGPMVARLLDVFCTQRKKRSIADNPTYDTFEGVTGSVLVVGFGRFGQLATQVLLAEGLDVTVIDNNVERIRNAARFGFKVYYGDGARLDVLRAAGIEKVRIICICIDDVKATNYIVELVHQEFPAVRTHVRAHDRLHALELMKQDVDVFVRETFDSALVFGKLALQGLGLTEERARETMLDVRKRDIAQLNMQKEQGIMGGIDLLKSNAITPEPLRVPTKPSMALTPETESLLAQKSLEKARA
jgi:glutathione-regulated potassium-efflux system protein KefB